ncbi:MAG: hypothetical protein D6B28_09685 [Gammaproteobacteria bacterium]|nr:MAG: hypothetical protein D6B28_09685 [Gammaproteobacteria bacterium]
MIYIDRMSIQLPNGFEKRGHNIARLVGEYLQSAKATKTASIDVLSVSGISASQNDSDESIANNIAESIIQQSIG